MIQVIQHPFHVGSPLVYGHVHLAAVTGPTAGHHVAGDIAYGTVEAVKGEPGGHGHAAVVAGSVQVLDQVFWSLEAPRMTPS
jgi:hypothetical protein